MAYNPSFTEQLVVGEYLESVLSWFWEDDSLEIYCKRQNLLNILKKYLSGLLKYGFVIVIYEFNSCFCGSVAVSEFAEEYHLGMSCGEFCRGDCLKYIYDARHC